ncbi:MAG: hypothetical protein QUV05_08145 [Phycisphaerae bacterium]|nr:hypothetical protein [Phycisphaerae bacterium]
MLTKNQAKRTPAARRPTSQAAPKGPQKSKDDNFLLQYAVNDLNSAWKLLKAAYTILTLARNSAKDQIIEHKVAHAMVGVHDAIRLLRSEIGDRVTPRKTAGKATR